MGLGVLVLAAALRADERSLERSRAQVAALQQGLQDVIARCAPAVAAIENLAVEVDAATNEVTASVRARGSGVVITPEGRLITNVHVVAEADALAVLLPGGVRRSARLVADAGAGEDARGDVALLEIAGPGPFAFVDWRHGGTRTIAKGSFVIAMGNPLGHARDGTPVASLGIVSGEERAASIDEYRYLSVIRHDAAVNPGSSGGPLFDLDGDLIGINGLIYMRESANSGIAFAIPMDQVRDFLPALMEGRDFAYGYLGLVVYETLEIEDGLLVVGCEPGSPAAEAGLELGDELTKVGARDTRTLGDFLNATGKLPVGERVALHVRKAGLPPTRRIVVRLAQPPRGGDSSAVTAPRARLLRGWLGVHWEMRLGSPWVVSVLPDTGASRAGVQVGDVIAGWGEDGEGSGGALLKALEQRKAGETFPLRLRREGRSVHVDVELDPLMKVARVLQ